jgi:uncharacterized protein with GYD domain
MPTYILFSKLTTEGVRTVKNNPSRILEVNEEIKALGIEVKNQFASLGPHHFITVVEAPNEQAIARAAIELGSRGTATYEIVPAITVEKLIESFAEASAA